jgi:Flp pilus assembly protein TadD
MESAFRTNPKLERLGLDFLADFLERARVRQPRNAEVLAELGATYTKLGRFRDGLAVDREVVALSPDNATSHYNLACSLALCDEVERALDALEEAVRLGYHDAQHLEHDEDLRALRNQPRFDELVKRLRGAKE